MTNYFAFIDESGNSRQERFFGLGLLIIDDEIGKLYDTLKPYYEKVFENSKLQKENRIRDLERQKEVSQISAIANSNKRFELKFKFINNTTNLIYKELIEKYFEFKKARFCSLVVDRFELMKKQPKINLEPWDIYISRAAMLLASNIKNIHPCQICVLADDLTRPRSIRKTFEKSLKDSINFRLAKSNISESIFGVARLESHSSLMLQIVDILLGCVMYDYKKEAGLISKKLAQRQEVVVEKTRNILKTKSLAVSKTFHDPNYFSVWKLQN